MPHRLEAKPVTPAKRNRWTLGVIVTGLTIILSVIITALPFAVNDGNRKFLGSVDRVIACQDYADAQRQIEERMAQGAAGTEYSLRLGICQSMQRHFAAAERTFDEALRKDPGEARLIYNRALLDYRRQKHRAALERLTELAAAAPYFPGVQYHMGRIHEIQGQPKEALACYVRELNLDPASSTSWRRYLHLRQQLQENSDTP
jgi:tetratricopeptide (TPR) repeat protein